MVKLQVVQPPRPTAALEAFERCMAKPQLGGECATACDHGGAADVSASKAVEVWWRGGGQEPKQSNAMHRKQALLLPPAVGVETTWGRMPGAFETKTRL